MVKKYATSSAYMPRHRTCPMARAKSECLLCLSSIHLPPTQANSTVVCLCLPRHRTCPMAKAKSECVLCLSSSERVRRGSPLGNAAPCISSCVTVITDACGNGAGNGWVRTQLRGEADGYRFTSMHH